MTAMGVCEVKGGVVRCGVEEGLGGGGVKYRPPRPRGERKG